MNLSLNPDVQNLINAHVNSGKYATPEDVVAAAVLALDQQEQFGDFEAGELDDLLAEGERSIEQEGTLDGDAAFRLRGKRRRAAANTPMNYRISRRADTDIERICDRIAEDNPEAADRLDEQIHRAVQLLADFPGMGHTRPDVQDNRYLFRAVGSYVIAYRVEKKELVVVRVLHGARDFRKLFNGKQQ